MKTTLANPALNRVVRDFIANPAAEFPTTEAKNPITNMVGQMPHGFTQRQQALCLLTCLYEAGLMVQSDDPKQAEQDFTAALTIIYDQSNGSASRQTLEGAGLLAKTEATKRGVDPAALALKWRQKMNETAPVVSATPTAPEASKPA